MGLLRQYLKIRGQWQIGDRWNCADSAASWLQIENSSWKSGGFWWHQCRLLRRRNKKNCSRIFLQTSEKCTVMLSDEWTIRVYKRKGMIFISQVWTTSNIQYSNCHTDHNLLWGKEGGDWGGPASGNNVKEDNWEEPFGGESEREPPWEAQVHGGGGCFPGPIRTETAQHPAG